VQVSATAVNSQIIRAHIAPLTSEKGKCIDQGDALMNYSDTCVICNSNNLNKYSAVISPFLAERIWGIKSFPLNLFWCKDCDFIFYNLRPDDDEMSKLYNNYRDHDYQKQREKHEKWYTEQINHLISGDTEQKNRKAASYEIIKSSIDIHQVNTIIDYGGDRGQFILDEFTNATKYVYDISNVNPVAGVNTINNKADILQKFDFIMCCNLIEHVSYPLDILRSLKEFAHSKSIFYFEVPLDSPRKFFYSMRHYPFLCNILYSTLNRRPLMHEHLNHFSTRSFKNMLKIECFNIIYIGTNTIDLGWTKGTSLYCLASCTFDNILNNA
jgi:hypothetical protein